MKSKSRGSSPRWVVRGLASLMVVLGLGACGSDDNSNESDTGAGGASTTGDPTTGMGGLGGTSSTTATNGGVSTTSVPSMASMTANTSGSGTTSTTGFGGETAGPGTGSSESGGSGGSGFGGSSAEETTTTGGTGGTDVAPGETGVFEGTVAAHNEARAEVDVMPPLPELVWSDDLAEVAQDWADTLVDEANCGNIFHRPSGMYGENIALQGSFGGSGAFTGPDAVAGWVAEIDCYTYGTIGQTEQCDAGCIAELNSSGCGHYTQVVWDSTTAVGCGYGSCDGGQFTYEVIVCNYDPPGNYIGETPY